MLPAYWYFLATVYGICTTMMLVGFLSLAIPSFIETITDARKRWKRRHLRVVQ